MLIKMMSRPLSRPDLKQIITYVNQGRASFDDEPNFIIRYNTNGTNCKEVASHFRENNTLIKQRKGKRNGVVHIVLSWHRKEQHLLNDRILFDFGKKFCELINGENSIIFCRPHYDRQSTHLHVVQSASLLNSGRSTRMSKARLKEIQIEMNRYQQQQYRELKYSLLYLPELKKSRKFTLTGIPLPEKMKHVDGSIRVKERGKISHLERVQSQLISIAKKNPKKEDFIKAIGLEKNLSVYYRSNSKKPTGIITQTGKKFRFKRLAIDIENLQKQVNLYELEQFNNRTLEHDLEK